MFLKERRVILFETYHRTEDFQIYGLIFYVPIFELDILTLRELKFIIFGHLLFDSQKPFN